MMLKSKTLSLLCNFTGLTNPKPQKKLIARKSESISAQQSRDFDHKYQNYSSGESNFRMPHLLQQIHPQPHHWPLKLSSSLASSRFPSQLQASPPWFCSQSSVALVCQRPVTRGATIRCMANSRRVKMVAKQIQRELSDMLLTDKVLQYAILPEASLGADKYLSSLTTITDVEVSADLQVVKVYVSVFGDERGKDVAMAGLKSKAKYVRSVLGKRMKLRLTPEIRFIEDESFERGSRVIAILDRIKDKKKDIDDEGFEQSELSDASQDDRDWEGDDADEDIIYVR